MQVCGRAKLEEKVASETEGSGYYWQHRAAGQAHLRLDMTAPLDALRDATCFCLLGVERCSQLAAHLAGVCLALADARVPDLTRRLSLRLCRPSLFCPWTAAGQCEPVATSVLWTRLPRSFRHCQKRWARAFPASSPSPLLRQVAPSSSERRLHGRAGHTSDWPRSHRAVHVTPIAELPCPAHTTDEVVP